MAEGYKDWAAGDILTAADLEDYTVKQSVMRFDNSSARTTALSGVLAEGMMSYLKDTNSVEVYDGSAWAALGGKILQVVTATYSTAETTTSATYVDTSLTASITPSSATSKVLAITSVTQLASRNSATSTGAAHLAIERGGSQLTDSKLRYFDSDTNNKALTAQTALVYLDSPATTSATTYTVQHKQSDSGSCTSFFEDRVGTLTLMEVSA